MTDFPAFSHTFFACSESSLMNLIGSGLNLLCLQSHSEPESHWTYPEVGFLVLVSGDENDQYPPRAFSTANLKGAGYFTSYRHTSQNDVRNGHFNYLEAILMTREIVDGNIWWLYWLLETTLIWDSSSSWQHFCYRNLLYSSEDCIHSILNPCTSTYWSIHRKFHIPVQKPHRFLWHTAWHSYRDRAHKFRFWYFSRNLPRKLHLCKKNSPKHDLKTIDQWYKTQVAGRV